MRPATDQVRVLYAEPKEAKHQPIRETLQQRRILESLRMLLSPFRLPRPLTLEVKGCDGSVDAYYGNGKTTLCYEYVELIQQHAPKVGTPGGLMRADRSSARSSTRFCTRSGMRSSTCWTFRCSDARRTPPISSRYIFLRNSCPRTRTRLFQGIGFMMASEAKEATGEAA